MNFIFALIAFFSISNSNASSFEGFDIDKLREKIERYKFLVSANQLDEEKKFLTAIVRKNLPLIKEMVSKNRRLLFVHFKDMSTMTPLHVAAFIHFTQGFKFFLDSYANPSDRTQQGLEMTTVHFAVSDYGGDEIIKIMKNRRLSLSYLDKHGRSAIHYSAFFDNVPATEFLLNNKFSIYQRTNFGEFPIHLSSFSNNGNTLQVFIGEGSIVDEKTDRYYFDTPLHLSIHFGGINTIKRLIQLGADINLNTGGGLNTLHLLARWSRVDTNEVFNFLFQSGAKINETNKSINCQTPYDLTFKGGGNIRLKEILEKLGAKKGRWKKVGPNKYVCELY